MATPASEGRFRAVGLISCLAVLCSTGCGDNPDPNDPSQFNQGQGQPPPGQPYPQAGPQPGYPQPGGAYPQPTTPPAQPPPAPAAGGGTAQAIPAAMASPAVVILNQIAPNETKGMQPEGPVIAGNFQTGQFLESPIQLQPNGCYTVVGVGLLGVTELDIELVMAQPPAPQMTLAADGQQGPQAILGGGGKCFRHLGPVPAQGKVIVKMTGGAGLAAAQVYKK